MRRAERQRLQLFVVAALVVGGVFMYRASDTGEELPAWDGPHGVCLMHRQINSAVTNPLIPLPSLYPHFNILSILRFV